MKYICGAAFLGVFLASTFPAGSVADSKNDDNCLLPANIKDKGFKCDSVGDFDLEPKNAFPHRGTELFYKVPNKELQASIGKELTISGFIVSNDNPEPIFVTTKFGDHGQIFRLINCKESFPKMQKLEITGKLKFEPDNSESRIKAGTPVNPYYYFDCQQSKIRRLDQPAK